MLIELPKRARPFLSNEENVTRLKYGGLMLSLVVIAFVFWFRRSIVGSGPQQDQELAFRKNAHVLGQVILLIAVLYVVVFSIIQYLMIGLHKRRPHGRMDSLQWVLMLLCLLPPTIVITRIGDLSDPIETGWGLLIPYWKNLAILAIAFSFWMFDRSLSRKRSAVRQGDAGDFVPVSQVRADGAVFCSLAAASILVGVARAIGLKEDHAYVFNTGVMCFHLFLGAVTFEGIRLGEVGNPSGVRIHPGNGSLRVSWAKPELEAYVEKYVVYVSTADFIEVQDGLVTHECTKEEANASVKELTGLINGKQYYVAVISVDKWDRERKSYAGIKVCTVEGIPRCRLVCPCPQNLDEELAPKEGAQ